MNNTQNQVDNMLKAYERAGWKFCSTTNTLSYPTSIDEHYKLCAEKALKDWIWAQNEIKYQRHVNINRSLNSASL